MGYIPSKDFYYVILSNVTVQIPNNLKTRYDINNIANQLDISYFKKRIVVSVLEVTN